MLLTLCVLGMMCVAQMGVIGYLAYKIGHLCDRVNWLARKLKGP